MAGPLAEPRAPAGLLDRSSRPLRIALRVVGALLRRVVLLRLTKRRGPAWIAWRTQLAPATVYRALRRHRLHRLRALEPREPVVRYCWPHAGDLVHLDTKKLGRIGAGGGKRFGGPQQDRHRGIGWNYAHVAVDDATRLAYAEELRRRARRDGGRLPGARPGLLRGPRDRGAAPAHRQRQPATARTLFAAAAATSTASCHWHTRPYRPQTNGKAEAFVKIVQNGWAYKRPYDSTAERIAALPRLPALLQWLPTAWRPGRRHTAGQAQVNNLPAPDRGRPARRRPPAGLPSSTCPTRVTLVRRAAGC